LGRYYISTKIARRVLKDLFHKAHPNLFGLMGDIWIGHPKALEGGPNKPGLTGETVLRGEKRGGGNFKVAAFLGREKNPFWGPQPEPEPNISFKETAGKKGFPPPSLGKMWGRKPL